MEDHQAYEKELAIKNMRSGVIMAMILFGISLGNYLIIKFGKTQATTPDGLDVDWYLVDLVLLFVLIWGVTRYSRFAAVTLFLYFLTSKIFQFTAIDSFVIYVFGSILLGLFVMFFLARAVKGSFDYHALMKSIDPGHKPTKKWMWWVMTPVVLVVAAVLTLGLLSHYEITPATLVKSANEVTPKERDNLVALNLIDAQTQVDYLYSYGTFSLQEGGVVMTDTELIVFAEHEGDIYFDRLTFGAMDWVKRLRQGSDIEDSLYQVAGKEQYQGFQFELSIEGNMDTVFFQELKKRINPPPPREAIPMPEF